MTGQAVRVLSLHWGFGTGGVANYAAQLESVRDDGAIDMHSLVFVRRGRQVDLAGLDQLENRIVVEYSSMADPAWMKALRDTLRGIRPHLVITHGFNGHFIVFLARLFGWLDAIPVATYHGPYHAMSRSGMLKKFLFDRFTNYYLRKHAASVLSVAAHEARALMRNGVDQHKITVVHNGIADVSVPDASRERVRREWAAGPGDVLVGVVSRLEPVKGVADAVEAMLPVSRNCPSVRMIIIGSGSQEHALRELVDARGLAGHIVFAGFRSDIAACLSACDIFLLPSHSECHSIALLEAMRAAKPIVATDVGGNVETVADGAEALLVPAASPGRIAGAITTLVRDGSRARAMGDAARVRFLADFTAEVSVSKSRRWLRECAQSL